MTTAERPLIQLMFGAANEVRGLIVHDHFTNGHHTMIFGTAAFIEDMARAAPMERLPQPRETEDGLQTHVAAGACGPVPVILDDTFPIPADGFMVMRWADGIN